MSADRPPLAVCLIASEVAPLSKTGGLGDVSGALAKYLHAAGQDVRVFTPLYSSIDRAALAATPVAGLTGLALDVGPHHYVFSVLAVSISVGVAVARWPHCRHVCPWLCVHLGSVTEG